MAEPSSFEEYNERALANSDVTGYGIDVTQHLPCPFCAAPDFMLLMPAAGIGPGDDRPTLHETMGKEHKCSECGRSGRWVLTRAPGSTEATFFQTGGPDPPEWLNPAPPREAAA